MPISIYGENNPDLARFKPDSDAVIWRYMDIRKYLDLITRGQLWFTRAAELRKNDPYEGALTSRDMEAAEKILAARNKEELKLTLSQYGYSGLASMMDRISDKSHHWFQLVFLNKLPLVEMNIYSHSVSCWHENRSESDAMWELYAKRHVGIAIKSTIPRALEAFKTSRRSISIARVIYDSAGKLSALTSGIFDSILIKRHAFSHENEIRLIAHTLDGYETPEWTEQNQTYQVLPGKVVPPGFYIECDLSALVEEVVISPLMESYAYQALETVSKQFLPDIPIRKSILLTRQDFPLMGSPELALMWQEFVKTHRIPDFDEIPRVANQPGPEES